MGRVPYVLTPAGTDDWPEEFQALSHQRGLFCALQSNGVRRLDLPRVQPVTCTDAVEWLWANRIARGQVTLIEGVPGAGKSFVALDLVARTSRGTGWADRPEPGLTQAGPVSAAQGPASVLLISGQDDDATIGRRLNGLGADLKRIRHLDLVHTFEPDADREINRPLAFPPDVPVIERELELHPTIGLVVIDPLSDFCERPSGLVETLRQLNRLAQVFRVAIVVTLPTNCRFDAQGALRVSSRWRTEALRAVWAVVADPDDAARRLFVCRRMNFCEAPHGLVFGLTAGQVTWDPESRVDPDDPLGQRAAIASCLTEVLRDGSVPAREVFRLGGQCGFSARQMRAVAKTMKIVSRKSPGYGADGGWIWHSPEKVAQAAAGSHEAANATESNNPAVPAVELPTSINGEPTIAKNAESLAEREEMRDPIGVEPAGDGHVRPINPSNRRLGKKARRRLQRSQRADALRR